MRAEDAREIDSGLRWPGDDEREQDECPWVVWRGDVDDVHVHGGGRVEFCPAVGNGGLQGREILSESGDCPGHGLP